MPYVNIRVTRKTARRPPSRKRNSSRGDGTACARLGKNPATTVVVIDELDTDNWGVGGETVTRRRRQGSSLLPPTGAGSG